MQQPQCEVCGQTAAIHETEIVDGHIVTHHLCQEHGEAAWREAVLPLSNAKFQASTLRDLAEYWHTLPVAEKEQWALFHRLSRRCY
jgi:hypothetical protein